MKPVSIALISAILLVACGGIGAGQLTHVDLESAQTGATISPLLFGHNLEITRRGAWRGLSAEMVANRKFATADKSLPKRWTAINDGGQVAIDDKVAYAGRQSVRIEVRQEGKSCGIAQAQEALAFHKDAKYVLRLWLRTDSYRAVKAWLGDAQGGRVFLEKQWSVSKGPWQRLNVEFTAPNTLENNRLEISSQTAGTFWIGAVSVQPASAFHGMRRDVMELLKRIKPGSLRYPGGCYAEFYRWQEGLLPVDQRPPIGPTGLSFLLPDNDDFDSHEIGTDEFIALCREVGAEPAITVRLSENTPEDAAAWVEYCNGAPDTKWGKVRVQRGHPAPYGVKCWFVGNELYAFGRGGLNNPEVCARQTRLFAQAMKAANSKIRLTGCTQSGGGDWNQRLIGQAGEMLDLFSAHDYLLDHFQGDLPGIAHAPTQILRPLLQKARANLLLDVPSGRRFGIAFDEWNTRWGLSGSVGMGLYAAGVLNLLCRESAPLQIERACYFMPINEGAIAVTPLSARLDSAGEVFALYKVHQGNRLLNVPETTADADLDLCASATPDGRQVYVTTVNRSADGDQTLDLQLRHFAGAAECVVKFLIPLALDANAREFRQANEASRMLDGQRVVIRIPPCAIARVCFGKPGPVE